MKIMRSIVLVTAIAACGQQEDMLLSTTEGPSKLVNSVEVKVLSVESNATQTATDVSFGGIVQCYEKLESFRFRYDFVEKNKINIYASLLISTIKQGDFRCLGFETVEKKITFIGNFNANQISLVNLLPTNPKVYVSENTELKTVDKYSVKAVEPLCPPEKTCLVNGTRVLVAAELSENCNSSLGFLTYKGVTGQTPVGENTLHLFLNGLEFVQAKTTPAARCVPAQSEKWVDLIDVYVSKSQTEASALGVLTGT